jgi:hypothetical protein
MLSAEVVDVVGGWLWRGDKFDSMPGVVLDWFGRLVVVKRVKDKMVSIASGGGFHCMMLLTCLGASCCEAFVES